MASFEDENFYAAIGRLTISWAHLEFALDCMVEIMHHGFGGKDIEPEIPRALQRKINYLRAAFKQLSLPEKSTQGYQSLFDAVEAAAQTRHDVIHGIVIEQAEQGGEATMVRALRNKKGVTKREYKMTTNDLLKAARHAQHLGSWAFRWLDEFHDLLDELQQPHDEQKS